MDQRLLRPDEVAAILGISRSRVYELLAAGILPECRVGRSRRTPSGELQRWIERNTVADTDEEGDARLVLR